MVLLLCVHIFFYYYKVNDTPEGSDLAVQAVQHLWDNKSVNVE